MDEFQPKKYVVNLDEPEETRWVHVLENYKDKITEVRSVIDQYFHKLGWLSSLGRGISAKLFRRIWNNCLHKGEIKTVSDITGIDLGLVTMMQFQYEIAASCTSVVVNSHEGYPVHIRTMDWEMPILKTLTIEVDFHSNGKSLFKATTWAGFSGLYTGLRTGAWSISLNYRETERGLKYVSKLKSVLGASWTSGAAVREALTNCPDFDSAVSFLQNCKLVSPCYLTLCGLKRNEGVLITRDPDNQVRSIELSQSNPIVQANIDCWITDPEKDDTESIDRMVLAKSLLKKYKLKTEKRLWNIMSLYPINNEETVYGVYMNPTNGVYTTKIPSTEGFMI